MPLQSPFASCGPEGVVGGHGYGIDSGHSGRKQLPPPRLAIIRAVPDIVNRGSRNHPVMSRDREQSCLAIQCSAAPARALIIAVQDAGFGGRIRSDSIFTYNLPATDIASAMERVQEAYGAQNLGAVILASDGRYNQGANPLTEESSLHAALYTVAIGDSARHKDLRVIRAYANKVVSVNSSFEVQADIVADLCDGYSNTVSVAEEGHQLASLPVTIRGDRYDHSCSFTIKADKPGLHHYVISLPAAAGESNVANNRRDVFVEVEEQKKQVLIVCAAPHPDVSAVKEALAGMDAYQLTVCTADNCKYDFDRYSAIILHGLPSLGHNFTSMLLHVRKPLWLILGNQASWQVINDLRPLTGITLAPSSVHNKVPELNPSFNIFTLPDNIHTVTDKLPPLSGNTGGMSLPAGGAVLFNAAPVGNMAVSPLWLLNQASVPVAFLAGEGLWRWRLYEFRNTGNHAIIDECVRQTIAYLCANPKDKPFSVTVPHFSWSDQEQVILHGALFNANREEVNTPDVNLILADSAGHKQTFNMERSGTSYTLNLGILAGGSYTYSAKTALNSVPLSASGQFAVERVPLEMMEQGADYRLLYALSRKYGGGMVTAPNVASIADSLAKNSQIKPLIRLETENTPLIERKWYFILLLLFATAEWLLRKYWLAQ